MNEKTIIVCILILLGLLILEKALSQNNLQQRMKKGIEEKITYVCGQHRKSNLDKHNTAIILVHDILYFSKQYKINPWELTGTIYNESGFDSCAVEINARKWGIENQYFKKKKLTISNSYDEVMRFIHNPEVIEHFQNRIGLGYCQVRINLYDGKKDDLINPEKSVEICAAEMRKKADFYKTKKPSLYWQGNKKRNWYFNKVRKWAKNMGARKDEI